VLLALVVHPVDLMKRQRLDHRGTRGVLVRLEVLAEARAAHPVVVKPVLVECLAPRERVLLLDQLERRVLLVFPEVVVPVCLVLLERRVRVLVLVARLAILVSGSPLELLVPNGVLARTAAVFTAKAALGRQSRFRPAVLLVRVVRLDLRDPVELLAQLGHQVRERRVRVPGRLDPVRVLPVRRRELLVHPVLPGWPVAREQVVRLVRPQVQQGL
jgi:hypothetical protein